MSQEWKLAAAVLDKFLEFNNWKKADEDPFYDWMLVRKVYRPPYQDVVFSSLCQVKHTLKRFREKDDVRGCLGVLETCTRANFAAVESARCVYVKQMESFANQYFDRLYSEVRVLPYILVSSSTLWTDFLWY